MIVVSNTTPLIGLAVIGRFDLLRILFGKITIAEAVYREAVVHGHEQGGAQREVSEADWLEVVAVKDRLAVEVLLDEMDLGETETIVLAREINADWVLMDEKKGRRKLTELGIQRIGTAGILLKARQTNLISELAPELERLRNNSFSLSDYVVDGLLRQVGER
jgi:uncharacterized protein